MSSNIFTLYHAPYSVRSIMVRTAFAMKGTVRDGKSDMTLEYSTVNITNDNPEQLNEKFLCKVNPKGAVPALVNEKLLPEPITECVDISYYICELYPNLLPEEHESLIKEMLDELHKINFTILTFGPDSNHQAKLADHIRELLSQPSISKEYSEALSRKAERLNQSQKAFSHEGLQENELAVRALCLKVSELMQQNGKAGNGGMSYILGPSPTVFDAHMLPFLCRMVDVKRSDLIHPQLIEWLEEFKKTDMWKELVPNGNTLPPGASKH
ncbi:hypothetical protein E8E14_003020 [Neopestalotiopsis sp. 37M]|nr:hypothetical protein E8E14_003020 [Neopestalotiopsis sp. 37M]